MEKNKYSKIRLKIEKKEIIKKFLDELNIKININLYIN